MQNAPKAKRTTVSIEEKTLASVHRIAKLYAKTGTKVTVAEIVGEAVAHYEKEAKKELGRG